MDVISPEPQYQIRGIALYGFKHIAQFLDFLFHGKQVRPGTLVAINAEKILAAEKNPEIRQLLTEAEYKYPDGISVVRSIRKKYPGTQIVRIAGVDLWESLMERAGREGVPVFLIGGKPQVLSATEEKLRRQWNVNIVGSQDGYFSPDEREQLFNRVKSSGAQIVTIALGSPRQELFMRDCRAHHPHALYMGVGGTYDVFTGYVKRAPECWQRLGLEWLYRLIRQPSRFRRQLKLLRYLKYHLTGQL